MSNDDVYVVGQNGALLHFDGAHWSELGVGIGDDIGDGIGHPGRSRPSCR